jgi:hypothetical protein
MKASGSKGLAIIQAKVGALFPQDGFLTGKLPPEISGSGVPSAVHVKQLLTHELWSDENDSCSDGNTSQDRYATQSATPNLYFERFA